MTLFNWQIIWMVCRVFVQQDCQVIGTHYEGRGFWTPIHSQEFVIYHSCPQISISMHRHKIFCFYSCAISLLPFWVVKAEKLHFFTWQPSCAPRHLIRSHLLCLFMESTCMFLVHKMNFNLYKSIAVGWPTHEWRHWPRCNKRGNCLCCSYGCC